MTEHFDSIRDEFEANHTTDHNGRLVDWETWRDRCDALAALREYVRPVSLWERVMAFVRGW